MNQITTSFVDETEGDSERMEGNSSALDSEIYTPDLDLQTFLSRPIRIYSTTIAQGAAHSVVRINPWSLFKTNAAVAKKVENYRFMRGDLHINVLVNSTPFVYGLYGLSYCPTPFAQGIGAYDTTGSVRESFVQIVTSYTQRPTVYIEPHTNKGGTLTLPFIQPVNFMRVQGGDHNRIGYLDLYPIVPLTTASTATNGCTISIYAWMDNVKLAGPTLTLQGDEYATGPISYPATVVAGVASLLKEVPVIGRFATATEVAARAVGKVAALFGFTKVGSIADVIPYRHFFVRGLASATIADAFEKLTLDPKAELSIDTTAAGFNGGDELNIAQMCERKCVLTTVPWKTTDAVDATLFHANVSPTMAPSAVTTGATILYDTPMGNVSRMFNNWRGTVVYTVRVIASRFHQGRVIVAFDPSGATPAAGSEGTIVSKIWDIQESEEIQFRVPFVSQTNFKVTNVNVNQDYSVRNATAITFQEDYHVGRISIRVGNALLAPLATADATFVVSVHMEDAEFAVPRQPTQRFSALELQGMEVMDMAPRTKPADELYRVNMGERFLTLRQVMQRSVFYRRDLLTRTQGLGKARVTTSLYPLNYGYTGANSTNMDAAAGTLTPATTYGFNFVNEGPIQWMSVCFAGQRGSIKWTLIPYGMKTTDRLVASRAPLAISGSFNRYTSTALTTYTTASANAANALSTSNNQQDYSFSGASMTDPLVNPSLVVELPYQDRANFVSTGIDAGKNSGSNPWNGKYTWWYYELVGESSGTLNESVDMWVAAGIDYSLCGFVNVPPRYYFSEPTPGTPA